MFSHLTAPYQISDRDVPQRWHNLTYTVYPRLYRIVPVCLCMASRVSKRHDQLLIVWVVGAELLEWLHVSRLIQPQSLSSAYGDTAGLNGKEPAGNKENDVGEVHAKLNWLRQVTEVRLLYRGTGRQTARETRRETESGSVKKEWISNRQRWRLHRRVSGRAFGNGVGSTVLSPT